MPDSSLFVISILMFYFFMYACPPLKNDGRGELRFLGSKYLPVILERW